MRRREGSDGNARFAKLVIPVAFFLMGIAVAVGFMSISRRPERVDVNERVASIHADDASTITEGTEDGSSILLATPMIVEDDGTTTPVVVEPVVTTNDAERWSRYTFPGGANGTVVRRSVEKYRDTSGSACSGEVVVVTEATALNVRGGPSVDYAVVGRVNKGSRHPVLLWAWDEKPAAGQSAVRWFLLADEGGRTIRGWVSGQYCDTTGVVYTE